MSHSFVTPHERPNLTYPESRLVCPQERPCPPLWPEVRSALHLAAKLTYLPRTRSAHSGAYAAFFMSSTFNHATTSTKGRSVKGSACASSLEGPRRRARRGAFATRLGARGCARPLPARCRARLHYRARCSRYRTSGRGPAITKRCARWSTRYSAAQNRTLRVPASLPSRSRLARARAILARAGATGTVRR